MALTVALIGVTLIVYGHGYQSPEPIGDCVCGSIVGRIVETSSGTPRPISGATATLVGSSIASGTNSSGHFYFDRMPAGGYEVRAEAPGFTPVTQSTVVVRSGELTDIGEMTLARAQQSGLEPFLLGSPFVIGMTAVAALAVVYLAGSRRKHRETTAP